MVVLILASSCLPLAVADTCVRSRGRRLSALPKSRLWPTLLPAVVDSAQPRILTKCVVCPGAVCVERRGFAGECAIDGLARMNARCQGLSQSLRRERIKSHGR